MDFKNLLFVCENGVGTITINRPEALNALNKETVQEMNQLIDAIGKDTSIKIVVITGSGQKSFVAGADIAEMQNMGSLEARKWGALGQLVFNKIENLPQPVIAAINGFALGGGCELAMSCDIRIAADNAKFGQPEVLLGVIPGFAGTQRLPRLVGKGKAKELLFTGDQIDAYEAYRIGLVNNVVPAAELIQTVQKMSMKIMSRGPIAVQLCKVAVNEGLDISFDAGQAYEREVFGLCFSTEDQKEGMKAFVEKRKPKFGDDTII